jgi:hypothetical protein
VHNHHNVPDHIEPDPYDNGLVSPILRVIKDPIQARTVGILTNKSIERKMPLISSSSRTVRLNDVHELVCTDESRMPGEIVRDICYLAFIAFEESGVLAIGDILEVEGEFFGEIIGFNETHAPNHINIVIRVETHVTGLEADWRPGLRLVFQLPNTFPEK